MAKMLRPTKRGTELGIFTEKRTGINGEYAVVIYNKDAQQFILDNIEAIVHHINTAKKDTGFHESHGQAWTPGHDECLVDLFNKNVPVGEIAVTLKRSEEGIRARLKKLGLINHRSDAK